MLRRSWNAVLRDQVSARASFVTIYIVSLNAPTNEVIGPNAPHPPTEKVFHALEANKYTVEVEILVL